MLEAEEYRENRTTSDFSRCSDRQRVAIFGVHPAAGCPGGVCQLAAGTEAQPRRCLPCGLYAAPTRCGGSAARPRGTHVLQGLSAGPGCRNSRARLPPSPGSPRLSANPRRIPARVPGSQQRGYHSGICLSSQVRESRLGQARSWEDIEGRKENRSGPGLYGSAWRTRIGKIKRRRILTEARASVNEFLDFTYSLKETGPDLCEKLRSCGVLFPGCFLSVLKTSHSFCFPLCPQVFLKCDVFSVWLLFFPVSLKEDSMSEGCRILFLLSWFIFTIAFIALTVVLILEFALTHPPEGTFKF